MKGSRASEASPTELPSDLQEEIEQDEQLAADTSGGRHLPLDYQAFFELAPWPCVVTDTCTVIRQANQAATALFGRVAHAPGGRLLTDWIVPKDREAFDHWLSHGRRFPPPDCLTVGMRSHRNEPLQAELSVRSLQDSNGRSVFLCWFIRDLPQAAAGKQSEQAHLFRVLVEAAPVGIIQTDTEKRCLFANEGWHVLTGLSMHESRDHGWIRALHPEDRDWLLPEWSQAAREARDFTVEHRITARSGEVLWVLTRVSPQWSDEGQLTGFVGAIGDVTERKREIERRNRELAALNTVTAAVSSTLELPVVLDTFKRLVTEELSVPAGMIYLRDPDEERLRLQDSWGLPCSVPEPLTAFPLVGTDYDRVVREKKALLVPDFRRVRLFCALGLNVACPEWGSFLCVPLLANDCIQGAIGLFCQQSFAAASDQVAVFEALGREVSVAIQNARLFEQVRDGQERLEALSRRLVELQEMERRHIARELHDEVGQLLTGLKLSLEVAARRTLAGDRQHLSEALRQVTELIARVRDLSLDLRPAMLDDLGLLPTLLWHFDRYSAQTGIWISFEHTGLQRRFSPTIETAAYRIVQEALTNVARHGGVREVTVTLWGQGQHLTVEVYDRGRGFDPQQAWRVGSTSGLLGMRERAVLLGGKLSVSSFEGRGTQLLALLPIDQPEADSGQS